MITEAGARGKLILFGEHAAVWGRPAVGLPLPGALRLALDTSRPGPDFHRLSRDDESTVEKLMDLLGREIPEPAVPEGNWYAAGNISRAGGFGSSAALCVVLSRMVLGKSRQSYDPDVHRLANRLERVFHGHPSGIDTGMAGDLEPAVWRAAEDDIPAREALVLPEIHLAVGALPRTGNTAATVGALGERIRSGEDFAAAAMKELGDLTEEFITLCRNPASGADDVRKVGRLAGRAQRVLAALELSIPELDYLLDISSRTGALGGKLSGGGAGGAFWLVFPDRRTRDGFIRREQETGELRHDCGLLDGLIPLDTKEMYPLPPYS